MHHKIYKYTVHIYTCETWMRLCQANWQENKRNVPKSPLLTARRGGLTVYATPWSQKWGRHFGSLPSSGSIAAPFLGPVFGPIFGTAKEQPGAARRS